MIIAKDLLTYDVLYDFIIVAKSRSGKIGTKTVQVQVLAQGDPAPLDSQIQVSKVGFIKSNEEITVTCTSKDYVAYSLMVEVNGADLSTYYKNLISTSVPGKYIFKANSFNKDQLIRLTCVVTSTDSRTQNSLSVDLSTYLPF